MSSIAPIAPIAPIASIARAAPSSKRWSDDDDDDDDDEKELQKNFEVLFQKKKEQEEEMRKKKKEQEDEMKHFAEKTLKRLKSLDKDLIQISVEQKKLEKIKKEKEEEKKKLEAMLKQLDSNTSLSSFSASSVPSTWANKVPVEESSIQSEKKKVEEKKTVPKKTEASEWKVYGFDHKILTEFTLSKESFDYHLKIKKTISPNANVICTFMCKGKCTNSNCGFLHPSHCQTKCDDCACPFFHEHRENRTSWIESYNYFFQEKFNNLFY